MEGWLLDLIDNNTFFIYIITKNLKYPLQNESLNLGYRSGNSNEVIEDGIVIIEHNSGDLILMECFD